MIFVAGISADPITTSMALLSEGAHRPHSNLQTLHSLRRAKT